MRFRDFFYLRYSANDLNGLNTLEGIDEKKLRENTSILIIDNEDFPLEEALSSLGFRLKKKNGNEENFCINDYAEYDIVLCDISGVGQHLSSKYEGAFLANEIKKAYPNKIVISYTSTSYSPQYYQFQQFLDGIIPKGNSIEDWVALLDDRIKKLADIKYQWVITRNKLLQENVNIGIVANLEHLFVKSVINKDFQSLKRIYDNSIQLEKTLSGLLKTLAVKIILGNIKN